MDFNDLSTPIIEGTGGARKTGRSGRTEKEFRQGVDIVK